MASAGTEAAEAINPPAVETDTDGKGKGKSRMWLWIVLAAVLAAGGTAGAILVLRGGAPASDAAAADAAPAASTAPPGLVSLDTFLVNLNDAGGEHYLKLTLRLGVTPSARADSINADEMLRARIRDRILTVLTAKSFADIGTPVGKEGLRREIQAQINTLLGDDGRVQDVLFSEFVVQ